MSLLLVGLWFQDFVRLTPPLPETHYLDATTAVFAPGERIVHDLGGSVYVQPRTGSTPTVLLENAQQPWLISSSTERIVALAFESSLLDYALTSRRLDGTGSPFRISLGGIEPDFTLTADGRRVVYRERAFDELSSLIVGDITRFDLRNIVGSRVITGFRLLPGDRAVFRGQPVPGAMRLWRVGLDFNQTPFLLSGATVAGGGVEPEFEVTPDGTRVVFRGDLAVDGRTELWSTLASDGTRTLLSASAVLAGDVRSFRLTPDGRRVVYAGDQRAEGVRELFSVPVDGSAPPVQLSPTLVLDGDVLDGFVIDPTSTFAAFRVRPDPTHCTLYTAPIDGSAPALRQLRADGSEGIAPDFRFYPDGSGLAARVLWGGGAYHVLFRFDPRVEIPVYTLSSVHDVLDFELGRDFVITRARGDGAVPELWRTFYRDPLVSERLLPPMPAGHEVRPGYRISPDQLSVVFSADPRVRAAFELFQVATRRIGRPRPLTPDVPLVSASLDFLGPFEIHGDRALYRAPQEREDFVGLYSVPVDASTPSVPLTRLGVSPGGVLTSQVVGEHVIFVQGGSQEGNGLYRAFLDGHAPTVRIDRPSSEGGSVAPRFRVGSGRVYYVTQTKYIDRGTLWRADLDGATAPMQYWYFDVKPTFELTRDGRTVVCAGASDIPGRFDLWALSAQYPVVELRLATKQAMGGDVRAIEISPDDRTVVFLADLLQDEVFELFSVPIDGSAQPRRLNGPLVPGGDVGDFAIDPTSRRVVFLAEQEVEGESELYSIPLDASQAPVRISPPRQTSGFTNVWTVGRFAIAPGGQEVVLISTRGVPGIYWLHSTPIDGSAPARWLDTLHRSWLTSFEFTPTASGTHVVYRMVAQINGAKLRPGLFSVPIDGGRPPVVLNTPSAIGRYHVAPDAARVFYASLAPTTGVNTFYEVPIDGPRELSSPLVSEGTSFAKDFAVLEPGLVYSDGRALWSLR